MHILLGWECFGHIQLNCLRSRCAQELMRAVCHLQPGLCTVSISECIFKPMHMLRIGISRVPANVLCPRNQRGNRPPTLSFRNLPSIRVMLILFRTIDFISNFERTLRNVNFGLDTKNLRSFRITDVPQSMKAW